MDQKPAIGRIVHYRLTDDQAAAINKRRADAVASEISAGNTGAVVHVGNDVVPAQTVPMLITAVLHHGRVNGQVFLDGNDTLWVTSATSAEHPHTTAKGTWMWPPRV